MAVTSWTSEGMDWTSLQDKQLYPYAEALRLAINERASAAGETVPAILQETIAADNIPGPGWADAFQGLMYSLIAAYVNHTDNSGDWSGLASAAPYWTEATILTAISAGSRAVAGDDYCFRADWAEQQYALLNLLRWTREQVALTSIEYRIGEDTAFAGAVSDWNGNSWAAAGVDLAPAYTYGRDYIEGANYALSYALEFGGNVQVLRMRGNVQVTGIPTAQAHSYDLYSEGRWLSDIGGNIDSYYLDKDYESVGPIIYPGVITTRMALLEESDTPAAVSSHSLDIGDFSSINILDAELDPDEVVGWSMLNGTYVLKWDVSGGFSFVA